MTGVQSQGLYTSISRMQNHPKQTASNGKLVPSFLFFHANQKRFSYRFHHVKREYIQAVANKNCFGQFNRYHALQMYLIQYRFTFQLP